MSAEPESLVLQLLRDMHAEMTEMRAEAKSDLRSLRADVASDFVETNKKIADVRRDLGDQIVGLRRAVVEYHTSVKGHGVIINELDAPVRRVEQRLDLPPLETH